MKGLNRTCPSRTLGHFLSVSRMELFRLTPQLFTAILMTKAASGISFQIFTTTSSVS